MKHSRLYIKPYLVALVFLAAGIGLTVGGSIMAGKSGGMDYFAMVAFGIFALVIAAVVYGSYRALDKRYQRAMSGEPLLQFKLDSARLQEAIQKNIAELKAKNKALLLVMLFFCALVAIVMPFFFEDGYLFVFIGAGLAAFLALSAFIITKYRTAKLRNGTNEFILTRGGAMVAGEFHAWDMPGASITHLDYKPAGLRKDGLGRLEITYQAAALPVPSSHKIIFPIPEEQTDRIPAVLDALMPMGKDP